MNERQHQELKRELGLGGAVLLGLGSIIGTGVFVSLALATDIAGSGILIALVIAALLATANGLSSAQLAASHPVSGGTYEYGYAYLNPWLGYAAGWLFVCAKTASAATATLGIVAYGSALLGATPDHRGLISAAVAILLGTVVLAGLKRSNIFNAVVVTITLASLAAFVIIGFQHTAGRAVANVGSLTQSGWPAILHAAALMFVAYTGYGRVATLGEEVRDPRRTIPIAIILVLLISLTLYLVVAFVAVASGSTSQFTSSIEKGLPPLALLARGFGASWLTLFVSIGAVTAMLGVLLNLILGVSRVVLAMGRRGDLPGLMARVNQSGTTPVPAVIVTMLAIAALAAVGSIRLAWSFSALTVLFYYAVTNACALAMPAPQRIYPRWIAVTGLVGCLGLAYWIDGRTWLLGAGVIVAGLLLRLVGRRK